MMQLERTMLHDILQPGRAAGATIALKKLDAQASQAALAEQPGLAGAALSQAARATLSDPTSELGGKLVALAKIDIAYRNNVAALADLKQLATAAVLTSQPAGAAPLSADALKKAITALLTGPATAAPLLPGAARNLVAEFANIRQKIAPSAAEIDATWDGIAAKDAASNGPMSTRGTVATEKTKYMAAVHAWLNDIDALKQIATQGFEKTMMPLTVVDMRPGDLFLRKEVPPLSAAHSGTLPRQLNSALHNGLEENLGDVNNFHAGQWVGGNFPTLVAEAAARDGITDEAAIQKLTAEIQHAVKTGQSSTLPLSTLFGEIDQIAEERGGLGTTNALRALVHALQDGDYWVYRPKPQASNGPDVEIGEASSLMAKIWADTEPGGKAALKYSITQLGGSMLEGGALREQTAGGLEDAKRLAANPTVMLQEADVNTEKLLHAQLNPGAPALSNDEARARAAAKLSENQHYFKVREKDRKGGDTCSTFVVRTAQTAILHAALQTHVLGEAQRMLAAGQTAQQVSANLAATYSPNAEGKMRPAVSAIMDRAIAADRTGLFLHKAEGVSPKTLEHITRDNPAAFEFVGVLSMKSQDVLNIEQNFNPDGAPVSHKIGFDNDGNALAAIGQ